jgi:uncharacterized protein involved in exopolysaccharide biosynthesis
MIMQGEDLGQQGRDEASTGAGVELARMLTMLRRAISNWKPSAAILVVGLGAGLAVALLKPPTYRSETIVIYRQGVRLNQEGGGSSLTLGVRLQEILLARSRLEALSAELDLYQDTKLKLGSIEAVEEFRKDVRFQPRSTDTFSISYRGRDPETVQKVTARLAQSLIEENQRLRIEQSRVQREFLEAEKSRTDIELKDKELELARFLADHPEFALDQNASSSGVAIRAKEKERTAASSIRDTSIDALRRQSARLDAAIAGDASAAIASDIPVDPQLEQARQRAEGELASARAELNAKRASFTEQHPDVRAATARVSEAQNRLKAAEDRVREARAAAAGARTSADPEAAKRELREKKRRIDGEISLREKKLADGVKDAQTKSESGEVNSIVDLETEWARLSRGVSEGRDQLTELERNYFRAQIEASSSLGGYSDQVVVLDPAYTPTRPEPPGKTLIMVMAAGASGFFAMVIAFLRALLDDRIYEESDLSRVGPVLAVVPRGTRKRWWRS